MPIHLYFGIPALLIAAIAIAIQRRSSVIPRIFLGGAFGVALGVHVVAMGVAGVPAVVAGAVVASLIACPAWLAGWIEPRDVELVAVLGACLGAPRAAVATLVALGASMILATVTAFRRGVMPSSLWGATALATWAAGSRGRAAMPQPPASESPLPFALAALAGVCAVLAF